MAKPRSRAARIVHRRASEPRPSDSPNATFRVFVVKDTPTEEKIDAIRRGVRARVVDEMVRYLDVPKSVVFNVLHTPQSTAHRLIRDNRPLDSAASERVVRIADILRVAEKIFGGRENATRWLRTPNLALGDAAPLSMLDTEPGATEVRRILSAIRSGGTV
jgi:putative toxin-antitoxin system antitoxin component (TIGR02293 family)